MPRIPGPKQRILDLFLSSVGKVLDSKEIQAVGGGFENWERKVRALCYQDGYQILSHKDRPSLKPNQYLLATAERRPAFARGISNRTRSWVLEHMKLTCHMCGYAAGDADQLGGRGTVRLRIDRIGGESAGSDDNQSNLRPLCTNCYEGMRKVFLPKPDLIYVFMQIRRATIPDQKAVLSWLLQKYNLEATPKTSD